MSKLYLGDDVTCAFLGYCNEKGYQVEVSERPNFKIFSISNFSDRCTVSIYDKGTIHVQGASNSLTAEMNRFKYDFESNPESFLGAGVKEIKDCTAKYHILSQRLRTEIKNSLESLSSNILFFESPNQKYEYRAKITEGVSSLTITQYNNGTLFLQGKSDFLFNNYCDHIEKISSPTKQEVISRFLSDDEFEDDIISINFSSDLIDRAESSVIQKVGDAYKYLEIYDQKWFVASECLCMSKIPLPEFSALVMPASKAFEGYSKKLLVDIGLFKSGYFNEKNASFSPLYDLKHPDRKEICKIDSHADSVLSKISLTLKMNRNFMMHSDESRITKVERWEDARHKVNEIFYTTKDSFDYFCDFYGSLGK